MTTDDRLGLGLRDTVASPGEDHCLTYKMRNAGKFGKTASTKLAHRVSQQRLPKGPLDRARKPASRAEPVTFLIVR